MNIVAYNKNNYEEALNLSVNDSQKAYVPSIMESLALAYIRPWDEAFDPYLIYEDEKMVGAFYLSYTPGSTDNYWLGGYFIDARYQGKGYGKKSLKAIIEFLRGHHKNMEVLTLTVVATNNRAISLYESLGFKTDGQVNRDNEVIYRLFF